MIPLRDINPNNKFPLMTLLLIAGNVFVFFYFMFNSETGDQFVKSFALYPFQVKEFVFTGSKNYSFFPDLITNIFMHGSVMHLVGNCWFLWIFGDNVESRMGAIKYVIFYLLCGILASAAHVFTTLTPQVPVIGASGAIAGVMGAYLIFYPSAKIYTFVPVLFFWFIPIPAFIFLIIWFGLQLLNGIFEVIKAGEGVSNVAFWAHIGGFAAGMIIGGFFKKRQNYKY